VSIGKNLVGNLKVGPQLHLNIRVKPNPGFGFSFDDKLECSLQVPYRFNAIFINQFSVASLPTIGILDYSWCFDS